MSTYCAQALTRETQKEALTLGSGHPETLETLVEHGCLW